MSHDVNQLGGHTRGVGFTNISLRYSYLDGAREVKGRILGHGWTPESSIEQHRGRFSLASHLLSRVPFSFESIEEPGQTRLNMPSLSHCLPGWLLLAHLGTALHRDS